MWSGVGVGLVGLGVIVKFKRSKEGHQVKQRAEEGWGGLGRGGVISKGEGSQKGMGRRVEPEGDGRGNWSGVEGRELEGEGEEGGRAPQRRRGTR